MLATLVSAPGCDKSASATPPADAIAPAGAPALDIAARPQLLFQVFGDRAALRVLPLAAVVNGALKPIGLTSRGWHVLDSLYFQPGSTYPVYHDDVDVGVITVTRGMWLPGQAPLYPLNGCSAPRPMGAATIAFRTARSEPYLELMASSAPLAKHAPSAIKLLTEAEVAVLGRAVGHEAGKAAGIEPAELDSLDFHARLIVTGASADPTLLVSFIDPNSGDLGPGTGHTTHLFALAQKSAAGWVPAYRHTVSGDARTVEFRRIIDHADINGDGVDELVLESWRYGAGNEIVALAWRGGAWHETMRASQSWCLDPPKKAK